MCFNLEENIVHQANLVSDKALWMQMWDLAHEWYDCCLRKKTDNCVYRVQVHVCGAGQPERGDQCSQVSGHHMVDASGAAWGHQSCPAAHLAHAAASWHGQVSRNEVHLNVKGWPPQCWCKIMQTYWNSFRKALPKYKYVTGSYADILNSLKTSSRRVYLNVDVEKKKKKEKNLANREVF